MHFSLLIFLKDRVFWNRNSTKMKQNYSCMLPDTGNFLSWYCQSTSGLEHKIVGSVCQVHNLPPTLFVKAFVIMKLMCASHSGWASK